MRHFIILSLAAIGGCIPLKPQQLEIIQPNINVQNVGFEGKRGSDNKKIDGLILEMAKEKNCVLKKDKLIPDRFGDDKASVRARWAALNCIYDSPIDKKSRVLLVFLDGTANSKESESNIWRMYNRSVLQATRGFPVIPYYDRGVGTGYQLFSGSVYGAGAEENIRQAYRFLMETYKPGDQVFIFGFSRGAFTARSLNGFIEFAGLAKKKRKS